MGAPDNDETVEIDVDRFVRETEKALLVEIDGEQHWLPKSQLLDIDSDDNESGTVTVRHWLAVEKGLVDE